MSEKVKFEYTYSSVLKNDLLVAEVLHEEYSDGKKKEKQIDGIAEIKKLDKKAKLFPLMYSLIVGVIGAVIFGTGICMILLSSDSVIGYIVAIAGMVPLVFCIPVYNVRFEKSKKKYGPRIIELTEKIINNNQKT